LEYYTGTLHDIMVQRRASQHAFSLADIINFAFQIAKGLNYLHTLDPPILHRDMKSENIFVCLDPQSNIHTLKIGDFDTSKILEKAKVTYTRNVGTEGYIAP